MAHNGPFQGLPASVDQDTAPHQGAGFSPVPVAALRQIADLRQQLHGQVGQRIVGHAAAIDQVLVALLCGGHLLIEDVPGVGKTELAKAVAASLHLSFRRIQMVPDLLPADVTGFALYQQQTGTFEFKPGPLFANIVLADEINRATPKTQAALLEAMAEGTVTVDGQTYPLPQPFLVLATQNPVEHEGTYPLPEAQLDRFLLRIRLGYPAPGDELRLIQDAIPRTAIPLQAVADAQQVQSLAAAVRTVRLREEVAAYLLELILATRTITDDDTGEVELGLSTRASILLAQAARAWAALHQRDFVTPDDVKDLFPLMAAHRLVTRHSAPEVAERVIERILDQIPAPSEVRGARQATFERGGQPDTSFAASANGRHGPGRRER